MLYLQYVNNRAKYSFLRQNYNDKKLNVRKVKNVLNWLTNGILLQILHETQKVSLVD